MNNRIVPTPAPPQNTRFVGTAVVLATTPVLGTFGAISYFAGKGRLYGELEANTNRMADQLSAAIDIPSWDFDKPQIERIVESATTAGDVYAVIVRPMDSTSMNSTPFYARVRDDAWRVIAPTTLPTSWPEDAVVRQRAITHDGHALGTLIVASGPRSVEATLRRNLILSLAVIATLDVILILVLYALFWRQQKIVDEQLGDVSDRLQLATSAANVGIWDWGRRAGSVGVGRHHVPVVRHAQGSVRRSARRMDTLCGSR
ncbi:MAG TPA: hypothetical protein VK636_02155 [Gemmatimonadaceae bacterium]|nr:hypothetical protein [Gemmatimonadaceae bacterium]